MTGCPRKTERRIGTLESFSTKPGETQARVRVDDMVFNLPAMSRGVLQEDKSIVHCQNGDRYDVITKGAAIVLDLMYDADGKNPCPGMWAPKQRPRH